MGRRGTGGALLKEEATDELGHAEKLANRIVELGGDPVVHPGEWERGANAPFTTPRKEWADADGMTRRLSF